MLGTSGGARVFRTRTLPAGIRRRHGGGGGEEEGAIRVTTPHFASRLWLGLGSKEAREEIQLEYRYNAERSEHVTFLELLLGGANAPDV